MFANSKKVTTFAPAIEREILDKKDGLIFPLPDKKNPTMY